MMFRPVSDGASLEAHSNFAHLNQCVRGSGLTTLRKIGVWPGEMNRRATRIGSLFPVQDVFHPGQRGHHAGKAQRGGRQQNDVADFIG